MSFEKAVRQATWAIGGGPALALVLVAIFVACLWIAYRHGVTVSAGVSPLTGLR